MKRWGCWHTIDVKIDEWKRRNRVGMLANVYRQIHIYHS